MIAVKSRSGWLGGSDASRITGNRKTKTWEKWWMQKLGLFTDNYSNKFTMAGTYYEHRILKALAKDLGISMTLDEQVRNEDLRVRINYDGTSGSAIYECKTYNAEREFKVSKDYWRQAQMEMWGKESDDLQIVAYPMTDEHYQNYWLDVDPKLIELHRIERDDKWIDEVLVPNIEELAECLKEGRFPNGREL